MATAQQTTDRIESVEPVNSPSEDADKNPISVDSTNEYPPSIEEKQMAPNTSDESKAVNLPIGISAQLRPLNIGTDFYPFNYGPQTQTFFYGGYENPTGEWEEYSPYTNAEGLEIGSAGVYNENQSFPYHAAYGYNQLPYGLFSPATTPLPSVSGDGQLYSPQHFPFSGGYYQQPAFSSMPFLSSAASPPVSQTDWTPVDQQGAFVDASNTNNMLFGQRLSYQPSFSAFSGDWLRSADGTGSILPPAASLQPSNAFMSFGQSSMPRASGMASQQRRSYGFGSAISSFARGYHGGLHHGNRFGGSISNFGVNGKDSTVADKSRKQGRGNDALFCSCNDTPDFLKEHNRGPRANRSKDEMRPQNSSVSGDNTSLTGGVDRNLFNRPDFITEFKDAKFFVIKSYSEDNVHKSIKYSVWASTSHGNKKLDSAYREAKTKEPCPLFLFFSVNASAHFCGVAEMVGPVDFEKSVDYWQQDKWSGQFPVKWHIVKDVSNSLFRHIILENNDNKPVTNSRDTQEVKLEQGLEMLKIFASHQYEASILDDLEFYEEQEKAMLERKVRNQQRLQQLSSSAVDSTTASDGEKSMPAISSDCVNQISKSFADAVRFEENSKDDALLTDKSSSLTFGAADKPEDPIKPENNASGRQEQLGI